MALKGKFGMEEKSEEGLHWLTKDTFRIFLEGKWYLRILREKIYDGEDLIRSLDAAILQDNVLILISGIQDILCDDQGIYFVSGIRIRGSGKLERRVREDMKVVFLIYSSAIFELMIIVDVGLFMPSKIYLV